MKTRREKLEELAEALERYAPGWFTSDNCSFIDTGVKFNKACLALSEPDAPEQTADDVWRMWEAYRPMTAIDVQRDFCTDGTGAFVTSYRAWKSKQKTAKVPVFEITDEVLRAVTDVLSTGPAPTVQFVNRIVLAIQAATAKEPS